MRNNGNLIQEIITPLGINFGMYQFTGIGFVYGGRIESHNANGMVLIIHTQPHMRSKHTQYLCFSLENPCLHERLSLQILLGSSEIHNWIGPAFMMYLIYAHIMKVNTINSTYYSVPGDT